MADIPQVMPPNIAAVLKKADGVPSLPTVIAELERVIGSAGVNMKQVASVVEKDLGLTAKVLKVANSAFTGFSGKVSTVQLACSLLGMGTIEGLVTSVGVMHTLRIGADEYFDPLKFWRHSVMTGLCAQDLSNRLGYNLRGDLFTCGLLHDVGKIVMAHSWHEDFVEMMKLHRTGVPYREAERRIYGADHTQIGWWVGRHWGLPDVFLQCILNHHEWPEKREDPLHKRIAATYLGNLVTHMAEYRGEKGRYPSLRPEFQERFGLSQEAVMQISEAALGKSQQLLSEMLENK